MDMDKLRESADSIRKAYPHDLDIGIVLGSGLGEMAEAIEDAVIIDYHDIPHFPVSTVPGHKGRLVIGHLEGRTVLCMQGRFHYQADSRQSAQGRESRCARPPLLRYDPGI